MSDRPWIKWYAGDFLGGIVEMTPHEIAVYTVILNRMYDEDGPISDEPKRIARRCNMRLPQCEKAINGLVEDGKLILENGFIINPRAQKELEKRQEKSNKQASIAHKRWQKEAENANKIKDGAMPTHAGGNATAMPTRSQKVELESTADAVGRATRLPDAWTLPDDYREWAIKEGWPADRVTLEADKFHDYWIAASGQKATKRDWLATWRNWMRNVPKGQTNGKSGNSEERTADRRREMLEGLKDARGVDLGIRSAEGHNH